MTDRALLEDAFDRYAALIAAQIEALDTGDLDALEPLARRRDELAAEIERAAEDAGTDDPAVRVALDRCRAADVRLRAKIATLRTHALDAVHRAARDASAARSYAGPAAPGAPGALEL